jgi:diacylglycerol O-acyltransferase / wax synthase
VPVPDIPLRLHGAELEEVYPFVPLAHGVCFTAAIATYRNVVHIALQTTLRGDVDIDELAAAVPEALTALQQCETENEPPL